MSEDMYGLRSRLIDAGFYPVPLYGVDQERTDSGAEIGVTSRGKVPWGHGWQNGTGPEAALSAPAHASNTGIRANGLRILDLDIEDGELVGKLKAAAQKLFGETIIRTRSNSPRCAMIYRAAEGEPVKRTLAGANGKIEVLGRGQQLQAFGLHYTRQPLIWYPAAPGDVGADTLPALTEDQVEQFLKLAEPALGAKLKAGSSGEHASSRHGPTASIFKIAAAMRVIPNDGPADWEEWNRIGMALWAATRGGEAGRELWHEWSIQHPTYDSTEADRRWDHYRDSPPTRIGAGSLFDIAAKARPDFYAEPEPAAAEAKAEDAPAPPPFDPWDSLQPVPFSVNVLPDTLQRFVAERSRIIGADPCAIAWAAISACSAAIDGRIRLKMKRYDNWTVPPFIWMALVGPPSSKKSPILDAAWHPLLKEQGRDIDSWQIERAAWQRLPKKERLETPEPVCRRRLVSHDATIESLQDILNRQDRGLGVLRDELAGWIGSLEKYSGARGSAADRAFFLQAFNGSSYIADRVARGTLPIGNLGLTMCGGIQPDRLSQLGNLTADGLWQRFIPMIVGPSSLGCDERADMSGPDYEALIHRLLAISSNTVMQLSPDAYAISQDVSTRIFELEQTGTISSAFTGFCGKLHGLWGRLCLVLGLIEQPAADFIVSGDTAHSAASLLFKSVLPNAARVYATMGGEGADFEATQSVAGFILTKRKMRLVASDLTRNVRACRGQSLKTVQGVVSPLVAGGWLTPEHYFNPDSWTVAESVHAKFADRAQTEAVRRATVRAMLGHQGEREENE